MESFRELQAKMSPERQARNAAAAEQMLPELPSKPGRIVDTADRNRGSAYPFLGVKKPTPKE